MRVKNRKCIRRLSFKSLWASRKRNIIAICAIALTTLMFTSLFTIMLSVNSSYETYNFRQAGGYSDGSFKDLSREQADKIAAHKGIKASGERIVCGFSSSDVFGKVALLFFIVMLAWYGKQERKSVEDIYDNNKY